MIVRSERVCCVCFFFRLCHRTVRFCICSHVQADVSRARYLAGVFFLTCVMRGLAETPGLLRLPQPRCSSDSVIRVDSRNEKGLEWSTTTMTSCQSIPGQGTTVIHRINTFVPTTSSW